MPLSADDLKAEILTDVGDNADGLIAASLDNLWTKNDGRALWQQYLWTKRDAIRKLQGSVWQDFSVTTEAGARLELKQKFDNLTVMLTEVTDEIKSYRGNRSPVMGELTVKAPVESAPGYPDPNSGRYRGNPPPTGWPWR